MSPRRPHSFPTGVSSILGSLLSKKKFKKRMEECRVVEIWDDVVGDAIAAQTQPIGISKGVLKVTVTDHAWLQQLQFLKHDISNKLNDALKVDLVENIYFQIGKVASKDEEGPNLAEAMRKMRLTKEEREHIEDVLKSIHDDKTKNAARKAMINAAKRGKLPKE